ncbi:MAG TPA: diaminopimelate decarboxylase [Alphaproteobacteria bacterium]|nr:diaminopimelate decarboxylase [Alphaproteobacteria bacterium]
MTGFAYRNGILHAENVSLARIAETVGTPTYVYSSAAITANYRAYEMAFGGQNVAIHFALKANGNLGVLALLASLGAGADIVSVGEMRRALAAGMPASRIVFSGVGKTREELAEAVRQGIAQINVESVPELETLDQVARSLGRRQRIVLRVNPDVDARTHEKISTGKKGDKFGIPYDEVPAVYRSAVGMAGVEIIGIAVHIGSQLTDLTPFRRAYTKVADLVRDLRAAGQLVETIDLGGGIGVTYNDEKPPAIDDYATAVFETVGNLGCRLAIEPGRSIVASAGILLSRAVYRKAGKPNDILILDTGMNDLMRPSMYGAYHPILPVVAPASNAMLAPTDVVGPVCESGDTFARGRNLPPIAADDLVAFGAAGAYGSSMSSTYNARPLSAEVLVRGDDFDVVRPRQAIEAMFADEHIPAWLGESAGLGVRAGRKRA